MGKAMEKVVDFEAKLANITDKPLNNTHYLKPYKLEDMNREFNFMDWTSFFRDVRMTGWQL